MPLRSPGGFAGGGVHLLPLSAAARAVFSRVPTALPVARFLRGRWLKKKRRSRSKARSSKRSRARCSGCTSTTSTRTCSPRSPGRCASTTSASFRAIGSRWSCPPTTSPEEGSRTDTDESQSFSQAHVRALPCDQAARQDHGHLHEPAPQAEAGLAHGANRRRQHPEPEAARNRADLHLRHWTPPR